jgi:hypothetical protein
METFKEFSVSFKHVNQGLKLIDINLLFIYNFLNFINVSY